MLGHVASVPLVDRILPARRGRVRAAIQVLAGIAFLTALAQLRIQVGPVPITGQTLGVLLLGAAYGAGMGTVTTASYVLIGALGLPVFTGANAGWAYLAGPTGGYLIGFILAAALLGRLAASGWSRSYVGTTVAMVLATVLIYLPGLLWLKTVLGVDWPEALAFGLFPFLMGDALKAAVAVAALPTAWRFLRDR